jgi:hypothetical protein
VRLYPDLTGPRLSAVVRDAGALVALVLLAALGLAVHDSVDRLAVLGEGLTETGGAIQSGFDSAADAVDDTPLIGDDIAGGLRDAGAGTGGNVSDAGERGEGAAHELADVLGPLFFGLPAALVLALWLPRRIDEVRTLRAAERALADAAGGERRRLVAMRAAFSLPYAELARHTPDPFGDLADGRYDALVRAAAEQVGLRAPTA